MERVVIFGAKGMLGHAVCSYLSHKGYEIQYLSKSEFDISKESHEKIRNFIRRGDYVINCSAVLKSVMAKLTPEDLFRVNAVFPINLGLLCRSIGAKLFHITTDGVFDGAKGSYSEEDLINPQDLYAFSKSAGEAADAMIFRTSVIGEEISEGRSLLSWAMSQRGKSINGYTNHLWNGITTLELAKVIETVISTELYAKGLYHLHSPDKASKYELLSTINQIYSLGLVITPSNAERACDYTLRTCRKLSTKLITKSISSQIQEMRSFFAGI